MRTKQYLSDTFVYLILIAVFVFAVFPLAYVLLASFKTNMEIMSSPANILPENPTFDNYVQAWNSKSFNVKTMLFNSIWFSVVSVFITLILSAVCGYVFARGNFRGKKLLFGVFSSLMFISLGSITIYPKFEILNLIGLNKSLWGLVVIQCFGIPVVNMYMVRSYINALPKELDEAATIDGCNFTGIFFRIILPLLKPVIATIGMLAFQTSWNSYLMPAIFTMTQPEQQTLIVGVMSLKNSGQGATSWNLMLAGTTLAMIPVLFVYAIGSKYFTTGIISGAVKG